MWTTLLAKGRRRSSSTPTSVHETPTRPGCATTACAEVQLFHCLPFVCAAGCEPAAGRDSLGFWCGSADTTFYINRTKHSSVNFFWLRCDIVCPNSHAADQDHVARQHHQWPQVLAGPHHLRLVQTRSLGSLSLHCSLGIRTSEPQHFIARQPLRIAGRCVGPSCCSATCPILHIRCCPRSSCGALRFKRSGLTTACRELCNECHTGDNYEINLGKTAGTLVYNWQVRRASPGSPRGADILPDLGNTLSAMLNGCCLAETSSGLQLGIVLEINSEG